MIFFFPPEKTAQCNGRMNGSNSFTLNNWTPMQANMNCSKVVTITMFPMVRMATNTHWTTCCKWKIGTKVTCRTVLKPKTVTTNTRISFSHCPLSNVSGKGRENQCVTFITVLFKAGRKSQENTRAQFYEMSGSTTLHSWALTSPHEEI